ncbi:hypothetical protein DQ04_21631000, partial [Trypanosoma grayi]|uniref:hypothetical protein n=1 Tax=Trypanosoma grayi TaxID=71804 RepID=UPI0004F438D4
SVPRAVMMAAVGRPALFVVAVVLCCVCGCAATPAEGISGQRREEVALDLKQAKEKAVEAKNLVTDAKREADAVKSATEQLKAAAATASAAAVELNNTVKACIDANGKIEDVIRLADEAKKKSEDASDLVDAVVVGVAKILNRTAEAEKLGKESQVASRSAARKANAKVADLAEQASEKAEEVITLLSLTQASAELTRINDGWKERHSLAAAAYAKQIFEYSNEAKVLSSKQYAAVYPLRNPAKSAEELAKKAEDAAVMAGNAVNEAFTRAE